MTPVDRISYLPGLSAVALEAAATLLESLPAQQLVHNNWPEAFPYTPSVSFRMAHNGEELFIRYDVREEYTKAEVSCDNGPVWTDSCVEFFIAPDAEGYYNFEFNGIGTALLGYRKSRNNGEHASETILKSIRRLPSLGTEPFAERQGKNRWSLVVSIPVTALFKHTLPSFSGLKATVNVYKCGDELSRPHFLSWNPVVSPEPDFHLPRFFKKISFATDQG
ncbi:MAG: hypothetical protein LBR65_07220 [Culturomica sp.]|jgi:hypothetical protein|nr:hypothetical protein [Culturomica sp.]